MHEAKHLRDGRPGGACRLQTSVCFLLTGLCAHPLVTWHEDSKAHELVC